MEKSTRSGALVLLALVAYAALCRGLDHVEHPANAEITLEREQIFVKYGNGTTFSLMIEPEDSVRNLLSDVSDHEGVPCHRMHLELAGARLNSTAKLCECNIGAGAEVNLVIPEDKVSNLVKFIVKTRDGQEFPVETKPNNSVASLKDNITQWTGISQSDQRLLLRGKELKSERQLSLYGINSGTVSLGRSLADCRQLHVTIFVKTLSGATIEVKANLADTVDDLKEKIWQKAGVPVGVQRLSNKMGLITGESHLCDLNLGPSSIVYMFLFSSRITSLDQVARLAEPTGARAAKAPIFREVEDVAGRSVQRPRASIYKDARNWVPRSSSQAGANPRPGWDLNPFDPAAYLLPDPDSEVFIQHYRENLEQYSRPDSSRTDDLKAAITRAAIKLSLAVREHRLAANLTWSEDVRKRPGITLAGGFVGASLGRPIPLGADVNNWAPDVFSDADVMRLFEVSERVRRVLARAAQTGEGILSIASQKQINLAILFSYLGALDGSPPSVEYDQAREGEQCGICRDDLTAEPAIKLACEHAFHADCVHSWVTNLYQQKLVPSCPSCRQRFMFPYDAVGKAELEMPELQDNPNE